MTTPSKQDMDTDLIMYCSVDASVNVTVRTGIALCRLDLKYKLILMDLMLIIIRILFN